MRSPTVLVSVGVRDGGDLTGSLWRASGFVLLVAWLSSCSEFRTSLPLGPPEAPITVRAGAQFFSTVSLHWESSCRRYFSWPPDEFAGKGKGGSRNGRLTCSHSANTYDTSACLHLATVLEVMRIFPGFFTNWKRPTQKQTKFN